MRMRERTWIGLPIGLRPIHVRLTGQGHPCYRGPSYPFVALLNTDRAAPDSSVLVGNLLRGADKGVLLRRTPKNDGSAGRYTGP